MSESSETSEAPVTPKKAKTFFGFMHTDKEIQDFHKEFIHNSRSQEKHGLLAKLFGGGRRIDSTTYDVEGIREATRPPTMFSHKEYEPPVLEGKFITDRKGRMHRVRK